MVDDPAVIPQTVPEAGVGTVPPPTAPPPTGESPASPPVAPVDEVATLRQQLADYQAREQQSQIDTTLASWIQERTAQLVAGGWAEATAQETAKQQGAVALARWQQTQLTQQNNYLLRLVSAQEVSRKFNVPLAQIIQGNSPAEMEQLAKAAQSSAQEIAALKARLDRYEKGSVPPQAYDAGKGAGAMSDKEFEVYAASYDGLWPADVRKRVQEIHSRR